MRSEPIVVSYGMGLDSTAMLVEMHNRGMRPDLILFSDTGAEKPATYAYLPVINRWLESVGFPLVTVVKYQPTRANYSTLEEKCFENEVLPSLAYGMHQCALIFKRDTQVKYLKAWQPALDAIERGQRIVQCIGYDDSTADRKRAAKSRRTHDAMRAKIRARIAEGKKLLADQWQIGNSEFVYLLQDWGLERDALAQRRHLGGCEYLAELGLPRKHDLEQLLRVRLEVREEADLLEDRAVQVLGLVDDEETV